MANIATLKKFVGYRFSSGSETGSDFKSFATKLRNYIKSVCNENGMEMVSFTRGHYNCSGFVKMQDADVYAYWSVSDVRFWQDEWFNKVLFRTAKSPKDYRGGDNQYCSLENLGSSIQSMMRKNTVYRINGKTFTDAQMREIGRDIASLWGGECYAYTVDADNEKVTFRCVECGEHFITERPFSDF